MIRYLSPMEEALVITNLSFPMVVVNVIRLQKGPSESNLKLALGALQERYVFLRAIIRKQKGTFVFEMDPAKNRIALAVLDRDHEDQWRTLVRDELNHGFIEGQGPLMRVIYLSPSSGRNGFSEIILSFHHAIADATFISALSEQILDMTGKMESGSDNGAFAGSASPSPNLLEIFPPKFRKPGLLFRLVPFMIRQMRAEMSYKKESRMTGDSPIPNSSHNDILTLDFTEKETLDLISWSRKQKLSLHGIISALMLSVVNTHKYNGKRKMLRTTQFASLRPYLQPAVADDVEGCYIALIRYNVAIPDNADLKAIASEIDRQVSISARRGEKFLFSFLSKMITSRSFREKKERLSASALSYAGPIQLKQQYGTTQVLNVHGFISNNSLGAELSAFGRICFNRLGLDMNYLTAETSREEALGMANEIKSRILLLASGE